MTNAEVDAFNNALPASQNMNIGGKLQQALYGLTPIGKKFFLDPVNGNDSYDGTSYATAKKTLASAYALLTANKNETLYIIGGATANNITTAFTWAKSYTHCIGLAGPLRFGGRVRIGHAGYPLATMFTISGNGCVFSNLHVQHGQASATNLTCVDISGLRNYFQNCHFEGSLDTVASGSSYAWRALQLESGAQANHFQRCTFGTWTVNWTSTAGRIVQMVGDNADTRFEDCEFIGAPTATMKYVDFTGPITGGYSEVDFYKCL